MQKPKNELSIFTTLILSFVVLFAMGMFVLYPQDIIKSLLPALMLSPLVVLIERLISKPKQLLQIASRIEQIITNSPTNKKARIQKIALISLFYISFTIGNAMLLEIVTGSRDLRILAASPIVGAIYTYFFIKLLRKKRTRF